MLDELRLHAAAHGLSVVPDQVLGDALAEIRECADALDPACVGQLAVYPGTRLLVHLTAQPGSDEIRISMHDATLNRRYPAKPLAIEERSADSLLELMRQRVAMAPWSTLAFEGQDENLYISAGRRNGLSVDDRLVVRETGTRVTAPSGPIISWRPGAVTGEVVIVELVGDNIAAIAPASGREPVPGQRLTLTGDQ